MESAKYTELYINNPHFIKKNRGENNKDTKYDINHIFNKQISS